MKNLKVKYNEVKWFTTFQGFVKPTIVLDKFYRSGKVRFDSIALPSAKEFLGYNVDKATSITVKVDSVGGIVFKGFFGMRDELLQMPDKCPTCGSELHSYKETELYCPNDLCHSKSRTSVVKLLAYANNNWDNLIDYFNLLNVFPDKTSKVSVNNMFELMYYVNNIKDVMGTQVITDSLKDSFPEGSEKYLKILENTFNYLKNELPSKEMWDILSIKGFTKEDADKLSHINAYDINTEVDIVNEFSKVDLEEEKSKNLHMSLGKFYKFLMLHKKFVLSQVKVE